MMNTHSAIKIVVKINEAHRKLENGRFLMYLYHLKKPLVYVIDLSISAHEIVHGSSLL